MSVTTPSLLYQLLVGLLLKEIFPLMLLFDYIVGIVHVRKKKVLNILFSSYQDKDLDFYHLLKVTNIFKYHYELMD